MTVRFQYAGDKDISAGRSGGASIFSLPGGATCPDAGTSTGFFATQTYEAGSSLYITQTGTSHKNQNANFPILNDGACGTYIDTLSPQNIVFKPFESVITEYWFEYTAGAEVMILGNIYWSQETKSIFLHDGNGGYSEYLNADVRYKAYGTFIASEPQSATVPTGTGNNYSTGRLTSFYHDGAGDVYSATTGSYYPYGTFIFNDGTYDYYWDGNGDYYYSAPYSNPSYGTYLGGSSSDNYVYVSENGNNYIMGQSYSNDYADGNGGSYNDSGNSWYSYGQYINSFYNSGDGFNYNIYSDGTGSYYISQA
jgi:hypothetical protein